MTALYIILISILSLILVYFITCFAIFNYIFKRKKDLNWTSSKSLVKTPWKDFVSTIPKTIEWLENNNAENITITTFDNLCLYGKFVKTENAKGTVIVVHGYHGHYISDFGIVLNVYKNLGYNILMFRHRAHGESQGKYITFGTKEQRDLLSVIEYHNNTFGEIPIFISGISMGASTVTYVTNKNLPKNVKGVTADCGFTSPYEIIRKVINEKLHFNATFLTYGIDFWCKLLAKFSMKDCSSEEILKESKVPILFIHGEKDDFVPVEMSIKSYNACTSPKQIVIVENAGHGTSYLFDKEKVENALFEFFKTNLN